MAYMFLTKGRGRIFAAGLVASLFIMGCGSDGTGPGGNSIVNGDAGIMGESKIQTWAELDDAGAVIRVGVTAGASGLDNLTGEDHLVLAFPDAVQSQTFFNHMGFDFSDHGHGPPPPIFFPTSTSISTGSTSPRPAKWTVSTSRCRRDSKPACPPWDSKRSRTGI